MIIRLPLTGTVVAVEPYISGDLSDPIGPIEVDLGLVSTRTISIDLENEEIVLEVTPLRNIFDVTTDQMRPPTQIEKDAILEHVKNVSLERKTKEELYTLSNSPRLKNPFKAVPIE